MALIHKYTLVCDEVRREDNGKLIVLGLYTPGVVLQKFPARLPRLTFLTCLEPTTAGKWDLSFRFTHVDTGAMVGPDGRLHLEVQQAQTAGQLVLPITIEGPMFQMAGDYVFTLSGANFEGTSVTIPVSQRVVARVH